MTPAEVAQIVTIARRASSHDMAQAKSAAELLQQLLSPFVKKSAGGENAASRQQ